MPQREQAKFVGWVRSGFCHWEPVTKPLELVEAARLLHEHTPDCSEDGSKVLLPAGERPTGRKPEPEPEPWSERDNDDDAEAA